VKIRPINGRVLVKPLEAAGRTAGGIHLPDSAKEKPQEGKVVAVAEDATEEVAVGDRVIYWSSTWPPTRYLNSCRCNKEKQMAAIVDEQRCTGCGICEDGCPQEAITVEDVARVDAELCTECGVCVDECPNEAISLPGQEPKRR